MTFLQAVVLGIVQGLTEFLPISSTAHLRIVPALAGWHFSYTNGNSNDPGAAFTAIVQLGTMVAIVVYFWRELTHVIVAWFRGFADREVRHTVEYRFGWYLILATIPVSVVAGLAVQAIEIDHWRAGTFGSSPATLIVLIGLLLYGGFERTRSSRDRDEDQINTTDAIVGRRSLRCSSR